MALPKKLLKKLGLSLGSLFVIFVLAEIVARASEPGPFSLFDSNPYEPHGSIHHVHKPSFEGRWDGTWYQTNSLRMRGAELDLDFAEDEFRVVCVGDSCTFGKGVVEAASWPRQLEQELTVHAGGRYRPKVANIGVNGYSGQSYMRLFEELGPPLQPDLVVVGYNLNDFPNAIKAVDEKVFGDRKARAAVPLSLRNLMGRLALYRWARGTYYEMNKDRDWQSAESFAAGAAGDSIDSEVWQKQQGFLEKIKTDAAASGAEMVVFLFPYESQIYMDGYDTTPIERLSEVCQRIDVPFVDLAEVFRAHAHEVDPPRRLFLRGDRYHPTPEGYRLVAEEVRRVAGEKGWLPAE
jgi:lysophospholipase L1-like esterase